MNRYIDKIKCYNLLIICKYYTLDILIHFYLCLSFNRYIITYKKMKCYNFNII